ncbi:hypothetical protein LR48_Vigan01g303900 [Vigna angularis]|uniref:RING-type E3 ubiquitin transferase n=1 Tax=Phaseolus angularis TaxID=3914 RepID=A0A0L9TSD9_PHAAN|nr:RING-H2 finger protein ATL2 [Vigna angularis]KAG2407252.1 RING-H2 finger protein [Vigna angularis]KOM33483.1 hypothetical protein LR48_Vigan01g303900 [Vigna angularis]
MNDNMENDEAKEIEANDFALSGKIMLFAIVVLFVIIIIMLCLHVYVRCTLLRARRRQQLPRRSNRPQFVFYIDPAARIALTSRGLHPSVISTLPVFTFSDSTQKSECAVCLSEFENGETGRVLPKCNHSFHTECIDMWFQSHSTCPLCRAPVEAISEQETQSEVAVVVCEPETVGEEVDRSIPVGSSSSALRDESLGRETESSIIFPVSRIVSLKRILSREKKGSISGCVVGGCNSTTTELDAEREGCDLGSCS